MDRYFKGVMSIPGLSGNETHGRIQRERIEEMERQLVSANQVRGRGEMGVDLTRAIELE